MLPQRQIAQNPKPPIAIKTPVVKDTIDFSIIRCWDLSECLGGTNPYVLLNIPLFGQAKTHCIYNSTQPYFGCILSLDCPPPQNVNNQDDLVNFDTPEISTLQIFVYNKNQSISDEMIALGERDLQSLLSVKHSIVIDLYDKSQNPAGYIELSARYRE